MTKRQFLDALHVEISSAQNVKLMLISLWFSCNSDDWLNKMLLKLYRFSGTMNYHSIIFRTPKRIVDDCRSVCECLLITIAFVTLALHVLRWPCIILFLLQRTHDPSKSKIT